MSISNLPSWSGADVAYSRASVWTIAKAKAEFSAWSQGKKCQKFAVSDDVTAAIEAMNRGDEETLKALNHRYLDLWISAGKELV